jgi:hypothetical protein
MDIKEKLLVVAGKNLENMICVRKTKEGFLFTKVRPNLLILTCQIIEQQILLFFGKKTTYTTLSGSTANPSL